MYASFFTLIFNPFTLHKLLVLIYSRLRLIEVCRVNFMKRNLFSNANICRMKLKYSGGKNNNKNSVFPYMVV